MKRSLPSPTDDIKMKKAKAKAKAVVNDDDDEGLTRFDDNLLFEVLKHVDARTLAMAGCVNKQWHKTAQDERLWELICTKQWANTGCGEQQLRSVVLALGGFRRLHALYLVPLSKPQTTSSSSSSSSSSAWGPIPQLIRSKDPKPLQRLGKDEGLDLRVYGTRNGCGVVLARGVIGGCECCFPNEYKETEAEVLFVV